MKKGAVKSSSSFIGFGGGAVSEGGEATAAGAGTAGTAAAVAVAAAAGTRKLSGEVEKDLKAVQKKDSTTKIKALARLVADARAVGDDPAVFLAAWSSAFSLVSQDLDWRVRLEVWRTWRAVLEWVGTGKGSPLHRALRGALCAWLCGTFDAVGEVAAAARAALPFAQDKYRAALGHYRAELLRDVTALLKQTPQSLAEGRSFLTEQDALQMWENTVAAALLLARHAAEELPPEDEGGSAFSDLLVSGTVTRLFASPSVGVRRACLACVAFVSTRRPGGVAPIAEAAVKLCLTAFDDGDLSAGLETLVTVLASDTALWEPARLRPEKNVWPKLNAWLASGGARVVHVGFVLPLLAAAPSAASLCANPAGLPQWTDALGSAFRKAAEANKVRTQAAEVLGHLADCLLLLYTRHGLSHAARAVFARLLANALAEPERLPCLREQLFARPGVMALARRSGDVLWPALEALLHPVLPARAETAAAGLAELLQLLGPQPAAAPLAVALLEACEGSADSAALHRAAGAPCAARLWERVAARSPRDASFLLELSREPGERAARLPQLLAFAAAREESFLQSLITLATGDELAALRGPELDRLLLTRPAACAAATVRGALTDAALHAVASEKLDWAAVCAAVARLHPECLSEAELASVSAAALCVGALSVEQSPVLIEALTRRSVTRLREIKASAAEAAAVLGRLAAAEGGVAAVRQEWPLANLPWAELAASAPGLASLESHEWYVTSGGADGAGHVSEDLALRAAVLLELLAAPQPVALEEHAAFAAMAAAGAGMGRSHRSCDDAGFDPGAAMPQLRDAFERAAKASDRIGRQFPGLWERLLREGGFVGLVVCSQGIFARDAGLVQKAVGTREGDVRLAAISGTMPAEQACRVLVSACERPFATWADVDLVRAAAKRILAASAEELELLPANVRVGLAGLLSHRCWQAQQGAAHALSHCPAALEEALEAAAVAAASAEGADAWACAVTWWVLLELLADATPEHRGQAAARLGEGPFAHFAETVFALVDGEEEGGGGGEAIGPVALAELRPHEARDRGQLAGRAWLLAVTHLRTLARSWFGQLQDKHLLAVAQRFSAERVCGAIAAAELAASAAAAAAVASEGLALRVAGRSVAATVEKDDVAVELTVTLPRLFPLQAAEVQCTRGNLPEALLRRWVLSLTILLVSSECSLAHALQQWGRSAGRYFDGIESCHICFCVLSEAGALSKMRCANCKCSFHAECVAKWFATSHSSKCCMCQLPWKRL